MDRSMVYSFIVFGQIDCEIVKIGLTNSIRPPQLRIFNSYIDICSLLNNFMAAYFLVFEVNLKHIYVVQKSLVFEQIQIKLSCEIKDRSLVTDYFVSNPYIV